MINFYAHLNKHIEQFQKLSSTEDPREVGEHFGIILRYLINEDNSHDNLVDPKYADSFFKGLLEGFRTKKSVSECSKTFPLIYATIGDIVEDANDVIL